MSTLIEMRALMDQRWKVKPICAHRKCSNPPTEAHDVFSWFYEKQNQVPSHYEVCDKHAQYFAHPFDRSSSEKVAKDLVDWAVLNGPAINALREIYERALQSIEAVLDAPHATDRYRLEHIGRFVGEARVPKRERV